MTRSWIVGGALRDELLGREVTDIDIAVEGDPEAAARGARRGGPRARLPALGGVRRLARRGPSRRAHLRLRAAPGRDDRGGPPEARLHRQRDGARARPSGGDLIDPLGGRADIESADAASDRPGGLRERSAAAAAPRALRRRARLRARRRDRAAHRGRPHRAWRRRPASASSPSSAGSCSRPRAVRGLALADRLGLLRAVLPELAALHDVEQSHYHHKDVYGHTLEVLERLIELEAEVERRPARSARRAARGRAHARRRRSASARSCTTSASLPPTTCARTVA